MGNLIDIAVPLFGLIAIGIAFGKIFKSASLAGLEWLNIFIIYAALPALFIKLVALAPIEDLTRFDYVAVTTYATLLTFVIGFLVFRFMSKASAPRSIIAGLSSAYGNIGYLGPGVILAALGPKGLIPVALIMVFENTLHFFIAPFGMALTGRLQGSWWQIAGGIIWKVVSFPFIVACFVGVAISASGLAIPSPIERLLDLLAGAAAPCALFAMGVSLALRPFTAFSAPTAALIFIKLLFYPFLVWLLLSVIGDFEPIWIQAAVLMACLPTATNVFIIAQQYNTWEDGASGVMLVSTIASFLTVPAILYLFGGGVLPLDLFPPS
ncbi:MAG: AEC family transporter [Pseudomonadota bacterium]